MNKKEKIKIFMTALNDFLLTEYYIDNYTQEWTIDIDILWGILLPIFKLSSSWVWIQYKVEWIIDDKFDKFFYKWATKIDENIFYKKIFANWIVEVPWISYEEFFYKLTLKYFDYKKVINFYKDYPIENTLYIPKVLINDYMNDLLLYKNLQNWDA